MLYSISSATSVNNNYTASLTQPGVYYFSCPVRPFLHRLCSYQSHCSNACGNVCFLRCAPQMFTAICCCCSTACVWNQSVVFFPERFVKRIGLLQILTAGLAWFAAGDWSLPIWSVADRDCIWPCARYCIWNHLCNVKPERHRAIMRDHVADNRGQLSKLCATCKVARCSSAVRLQRQLNLLLLPFTAIAMSLMFEGNSSSI